MIRQQSPLANGRPNNNTHESYSSSDAKVKSKQQRRRPLQSRPLCTIVNGGITINRDDNAKNEIGNGGVKQRDASRSSGDMSTSGYTNTAALQTDGVGGNGNGNGNGNNNNNSSNSNSSTKPPKRFVAPDELPAFCAAIEGSCLTKIALVEELKRKCVMLLIFILVLPLSLFLFLTPTHPLSSNPDPTLMLTIPSAPDYLDFPKSQKTQSAIRSEQRRHGRVQRRWRSGGYCWDRSVLIRKVVVGKPFLESFGDFECTTREQAELVEQAEQRAKSKEQRTSGAKSKRIKEQEKKHAAMKAPAIKD